MVKHSVLIISYNQENCIHNAIESLLVQKEFLNEIVISDDCSIDKTWEVICEYHSQNPSLIKHFRQTRNVGIFKNMEFGFSKISGDVVSLLAGDDTFNYGVFKEMNRLIEVNSIDLKTDCFNIVFNHEIVFPDGSIHLIDNSGINSNNAFKLKLRNLINNRDIGISINILKKIPLLPENYGINTDGIFDDYVYYFSDTICYTSFIGEKYNAGIGVSSKSKSISSIESMLKVIDYNTKVFFNKLDNTDHVFIKIEKMYYNLKRKFSLLLWFKFSLFTIISPVCFMSIKKYRKYLMYAIKMPIRSLYSKMKAK